MTGAAGAAIRWPGLARPIRSLFMKGQSPSCNCRLARAIWEISTWEVASEVGEFRAAKQNSLLFRLSGSNLLILLEADFFSKIPCNSL
jgi:hypothetical protein